MVISPTTLLGSPSWIPLASTAMIRDSSSRFMPGSEMVKKKCAGSAQVFKAMKAPFNLSIPRFGFFLSNNITQKTVLQWYELFSRRARTCRRNLDMARIRNFLPNSFRSPSVHVVRGFCSEESPKETLPALDGGLSVLCVASCKKLSAAFSAENI